MTDEMETLREALKASVPAPSPKKQVRTLATAMEQFDSEFDTAPQDSDVPERPTSEPSIWARLSNGGISMLNGLTSRAGLAATTGLVTTGLAVLLVLPSEDVITPPVMVRSDQSEVARTGDAAHEADAEVVAADAPAPQAEPAPTASIAAPFPAPVAKRERLAGATPMGAASGNDAVATMEAPEAFLALSDETGLRRLHLEDNREQFANADSNPVKIAVEEPVSTFSIDVDTASWSVVRSSLMSGHLPPAAAVRVEEMVNYFPYAYPAPEPGDDAPFRPTVSVSATPWNPDTRILHIGLQGILPEIEARPPLNLVFLIDTSGSMQGPDRLPLLTQSFRLMLGQLRPEDRVAIVTYAGSAGQVLAPTPASDRATILAALDRLEAGGSTAGQAGIDQAYAVATRMVGETDDSVTRVILATDGDFNVGPSDPETLKADVARKRDSGVFLSVLGFGRGNLNDALMQALAQNGNGQAAFIDTIAEAQKVLVDQFSGALFPIAQDVKIQLEFNPAEVAEYRLIGYETRALRREDFNNDQVDAGEIGAGHQVTALYEVTPVGSPAVLSDPLRYGAEKPETEGQATGELGYLRLRYKAPGESQSRLIEKAIPTTLSEPNEETRFATAIAGFGQLLQDGTHLGAWAWTDAIALAETARGTDRFGYRAEAVRLMRLADTLDTTHE